MTADRGQAFTLEAVLAALLLVASLVFALQASAVTSLSTSTSSQHVEAQQAATSAGVLDAAVANGSVRPTVLYWNSTGERFHGASADGYYVHGGPPTAFGYLLDRAFTADSVAYNLNVQFLGLDGQYRTTPIVSQGQPSDHAVRSVRMLTLFDDDVLYDADGHPTNVTLAETSTFFVPNAAPDEPVYNVIRVEVVVWQT